MKLKLVDIDGGQAMQELASLDLKKKCTSAEIAFFFGLFIPLFSIHFSLKAFRVFHFSQMGSFFTILDLFKSDIFFYGCFFASGFLVISLLNNNRWQLMVLSLFQFFALIFSIIENSAHNLYMITGSALDFNLLSYTIENFQELSHVMKSESKASGQLAMIFSVLTVLFMPWVIFFSFHLPRRMHEKKFYRKILIVGTSRNKTVWLTLFYLFFLMGLLLPSFNAKDAQFARNSVFNLAATFFEGVQATASTEKTDAWQPPTETELVAKPYLKKRNLVFIILESTRLFSTSLFNKELDTTPFLADLAKRSLWAKHAYSVIPRTSKSLLPIHCGIEPRPTMRIRETESTGIPAKCLPALLSEKGYHTAYFQTATEFFENRRNLVQNFGFKEFFPGDVHNTTGFERTNYHGYEDRVLLSPSLAWHRGRLKESPNKPFFVSYLTNTSHHLYGIPSKFPVRQYKLDHIKANGEYKGENSRGLHNRYLNTLRYVDGFVKDLFQQYKDLGIYQDTVFVIVADHGEGFWEHDLFSHSNTIYEEGLRIPLLIHDPKRFRTGMVIDRPVQQPDILPTVVDLLGYEITGGV